MSDFLERSFWRSEDIGFSFSGSIGMSGGFRIIWKENSVEVLCSLHDECYLGIK